MATALKPVVHYINVLMIINAFGNTFMSKFIWVLSGPVSEKSTLLL